MKAFLQVTLAIAIASLFAIQTNAQNAKPATQQNQQQVNTNNGFVPGTFVDKDNNGVCDNYESRGNVGKGRNYVDTNRDGICDNKGNRGGKGWGKGNNCRNGKGYGHKGKRGNGRGYCCWYLNY